MYFVIRALKYLRKKIGKTIFMGIIFFVIANFVLAGLLIQRASQMAEDSTRLAIGSDITYSQNFAGIIEDVDKGILDRELMQKLRSSDVLSEEEFTTNGAPTVSNIKLAANSDYVSGYQIASSMDVNNTAYSQVQVESGGDDTGEFKVNLYENNVPEDFIAETSSLVDGNMISEDELSKGSKVVMIEEEFAQLNNLKVGDTLTLNYPEVNGKTYKIDHLITGIYASTEEASQSVIQSGNLANYAPNQFYVPLNIMLSIGYDQETINNMVTLSNVIRLSDPETIDLYKQSVVDLINLRYGELDANDDLYDSLVGPIEIVGLISNIAVLVILVTGGLIIGLITALTVNERKGEIGILLAVGERKSKIVMQFVLEVLIIAVVTFSLSIISGDFIGKEISNSSIASEFITSESNTNTFTPANFNNFNNGNNRNNGNGPSQAVIEVDQPDLEISLSFDIVAFLFMIGITLAVISTIIPSLYVMRFNPKQILNSKVS